MIFCEIFAKFCNFLQILAIFGHFWPFLGSILGPWGLGSWNWVLGPVTYMSFKHTKPLVFWEPFCGPWQVLRPSLQDPQKGGSRKRVQKWPILAKNGQNRTFRPSGAENGVWDVNFDNLKIHVSNNDNNYINDINDTRDLYYKRTGLAVTNHRL